MKTNNKLRKALDIIALKHSEGVVSNDFLIKACERYKNAIEFNDDYAYQVIVAKSCIDAINGLPPEKALEKAILPGQTKVIDGILYIYSKTAVGSKTPYAWHVATKGTKTNVSIGKGRLSKKNLLAVNSMFPASASDVKIINANIGGSTGAKLVEDNAKNRFIMKKNSKTLPIEHVKSEYVANQIYDLMGLKVPNYELYEDKDANGNVEVTLLSQYIPMTTAPTPANYAEMAKGFIADVVMANWDVYQNDNCLVNQAGQVFRVDNGSCMQWRARGGLKTFDGNVEKTYRDMISFNPLIFNNLTEDDIISQIDALTKKKDEIVAYVEESTDKRTADIFKKRIENLANIKAEIKRNIAQKAKFANMPPRKLKDAKEMYRQFTDDELKDFWDGQAGSTGRDKIHALGTNGWELLETICKARGFDARPRVVNETEYNKIVGDSSVVQMFRGLEPKNGKSAQQFMDAYRYDDVCFYGSIAAYGQGIYNHVNDGSTKQRTNVNINNSSAFKQAFTYYANRDVNAILHLALEKDVKVAKVSDLRQEILDNPPVVGNQAEVKKLEKQLESLKTKLDNANNTLNNLADSERKRIYSEMHYDEKAIAEMQTELSLIDWGEVNDKGEFTYPSYKDLVVDRLGKWVKANGGTVKTDNDATVFSLPNSRNNFTISKFQYENNAIKHSNPAAPFYNLPVRKFEQWFQTEHVQKVEDTVEMSKKDLGIKANELRVKINDFSTEYRKVNDEINKISNPNPDADIYSAIYHDVKRGSNVAIGIYAALKGYDAMMQPNGNGGGNTYAIVFNRSKTIVKQ